MNSLVKNLDQRFDLEAMYKKYRRVLKGAKKGQVNTRFPPEPSGYLHIGHVKAALLNYHYSKMFESTMLLRFDDTNPSKEKHEYEEAIKEDLRDMGIVADAQSYTSDHFDLIAGKCTWMIEKGFAYCDNTPVDQMRKERYDGIASQKRDTPVEENLKIWENMQKGEDKEYCVRAKMFYNSKNKCLRDPVMYRHNDIPHPRTGDKYKVYPTYDFACPIVDSIENVTWAMRTNEYADRNDQYKWFLKKMEMRKVKIYDYSRLCFINTTMSKRKLAWFVEKGLVEGWNDPRFPTFRGVTRRGLLMKTLVAFMLEQGPSKNTNLQEWDKLWALNKKNLDPISRRFVAIADEKQAKMVITNADEIDLTTCTVPLHPKKKEAGEKPLHKSKEIKLEYDDAVLVSEGEKLTIMKWGNFVVEKKTILEDGGIVLEGRATLDDKNFKGTKKLTWLPMDEHLLVDATFLEFGHLLKVHKVEENDVFEDCVNHENKFETPAKAEATIKCLQEGAYIQFERRGFFRLDKISTRNGKVNYEFILIPDGRTKNISTLTSKINAKHISKG